jgi:hypothetical protein
MASVLDERTIAAVRAGCEEAGEDRCRFPECRCGMREFVDIPDVIRAALAAADAHELPCMRWRGSGKEPPKWITPCGVLKYRSRADAIDD